MYSTTTNRAMPAEEALILVRNWLQRQPYTPDDLPPTLKVLTVTPHDIYNLTLNTQYLTSETSIATSHDALAANPWAWLEEFKVARVFADQTYTFLTNTMPRSEPCPATVNCLFCAGSGRLSCSGCGGSGTVTDPADFRGPGASRPCPSCGGSGLSTCNRCGGVGTELCPKCQGSGTYVYQVYEILAYHLHTTHSSRLLNATPLTLTQLTQSRDVLASSQTLTFALGASETALIGLSPEVQAAARALVVEGTSFSHGEVLFQGLTSARYAAQQVIVQMGAGERTDTVWIYGSKNDIHWPQPPVDPAKVRRSMLTCFGLIVGVALVIAFVVWRIVQSPVAATPQPTTAPAVTAVSAAVAGPKPDAAPGSALTGRRKVKSEGLNVRSTPDPNADNIVAQLSQGAQVQLTGQSAEFEGKIWVEVLLADGRSGWVNLDFLEE